MTYEINENLIHTGTWNIICMKAAVLLQVYNFLHEIVCMCHIKLAYTAIKIF